MVESGIENLPRPVKGYVRVGSGRGRVGRAVLTPIAGPWYHRPMPRRRKGAVRKKGAKKPPAASMEKRRGLDPGNKEPEGQPGRPAATSGAGAGGRWVSPAEIVQLVVSYAAVLGVAHFAGMLWGLAAAAVAVVLSHRSLSRLLRRAVWEQWELIQRESAEQFPPEKGFDWRPLVVLALVAVVLTGNNYFGHRPHFRYLVAQAVKKAEDAPLLEGASMRNASGHRGVQVVYHRRFKQRVGQWARIFEFGYWAGWRVGGFLLIPLLVVLLLPGERLRDYGLGTRGMTEHLWIYVILFGIVLPAVVVVSYTGAFKYHYPFPWSRAHLAEPLPWRMLLAWEVMYAAQFFALEFFFRGFMLSALRRSMGAYAIFAMVVPYTMIHFGKPLAETLGAFAAGLILGTLALRTRSIWCGVFIHISVAVSMDVAALLQKGTFPIGW